MVPQCTQNSDHRAVCCDCYVRVLTFRHACKVAGSGRQEVFSSGEAFVDEESSSWTDPSHGGLKDTWSPLEKGESGFGWSLMNL